MAEDIISPGGSLEDRHVGMFGHNVFYLSQQRIQMLQVIKGVFIGKLYKNPLILQIISLGPYIPMGHINKLKQMQV